jgi:hypothetical protein
MTTFGILKKEATCFSKGSVSAHKLPYSHKTAKILNLKMESKVLSETSICSAILKIQTSFLSEESVSAYKNI